MGKWEIINTETGNVITEHTDIWQGKWQRSGIIQPKLIAPTLVDGVDPQGNFYEATLRHISPEQQRQIQSFADKYQVDVVIIGSRARGNINSLSDFDYFILGGNAKIQK